MNYRADRLTDTNADLESEVTRLQNMISTNNLKFKQEKDKLTQERDDLRKDNLKLNSRDVQFQHDLKKHESAYAKLQDQLRKALQDREPIKNTIEVTQSLHSNGISVEAVKGDHEFLYFLQKGYESSLEEASEIINMLLSSLNLVFKATEKIVEFKLKVKMA